MAAKPDWLDENGSCVDRRATCRHCGRTCGSHSFMGHHCPADDNLGFESNVFEPKIRTEVVESASPVIGIESTLQERGSRYGSFSEHARITQNIKAAYRDSPNWEKLTPAQKESLEMNAHKVGRILNGDPNYKDSWVDIEGYTHLISADLKD